LVEVTKGSDKDPRPMPKLVASCRTNVMDGMEVGNLTSPKVIEARKGVVEFLLLNHPLDCPICDQAGECHLQDLGYEHGSAKTRTDFERRTFEKISLGDKIQLHMTRCILCYRCVKVADQITDYRVHGVLNRGDHSEISTYIEKAIDNDFSGNMIDVCPVGALTDKTFRFKSRVWFTKPVCEVEEFICNTCRYDKKKTSDWEIEGPAPVNRHSVISANHYQVLKKGSEFKLNDVKPLPITEGEGS
jgi:NADH-quinone oxidoreductase subunit G